MGIEFNIEHASLVGWLTRRDFPVPLERGPFPGPWEMYWDMHRHRRYRHLEMDAGPVPPWRAPRATRATVSSFLRELPRAVVTHDDADAESLRRLVNRSTELLSGVSMEGRSEADPLPSTDVAHVLAPLRLWFDVPFYFMPFGTDLSLESVRQSPSFTLWLLCGDDRKWQPNRDLLDPFPGIQAILSRTGVDADSQAATLCWNWAGETLVIPQSRTPVRELLSLTTAVPPEFLWREIAERAGDAGAGFNLLQLSDLHFGASAVSARQVSYVEQHLRGRIEETRRAGGVIQPIVTGDLMDSPSKKNLIEFEAFRNRLEDTAKTKTICIPGNHDMRKKGFLWRNWEHVSSLEWQNVIASDVCKTIFVCFDTSKEAKLAQGKITKDQFIDVATKLDGMKRLGKYDDHICVTLVHHHPFSTHDDEVDTLPFLRIKEEPYLRMENGEDLVKWCASRNVPLILHGHKHRPRFVGREIEFEGRTRLVRAIGCGSSFGIEGKPLSYNWITWKPAARRRASSYLSRHQAARGRLSARVTAAVTTSVRSGFRVTVAMCDQVRVAPDHRRGLFWRAWA